MDQRDVMGYSCEEVVEFVKKGIPTISEGVLSAIANNKIDGEIFLEIDEESLREIAPLIGDRAKLKKIIAKLRNAETLAKVRLTCFCVYWSL